MNLSAGNPLNVLHVTYDMRIGGTEQVIRNLIEASDPAAVIHSIFCIEEPLGPWGEELRDNGITIASVKRNDGFDLSVVRTIRREVKAQRIDVVHCHQYTPWVYGALAALGLRSRVIFTEHGRFYPDSASPKRKYINPLLARITDHITAISRATKQALVDYEYLPAERIEVIYNGIKGLEPDPEGVKALKAVWNIPQDAPVLGTIARFDPIKNHRMMLEAFSLVLNEYPDCRLLLVGDGEERANIEAQIATLGIQDRVIMPGYIPNPRTWLDAMGVFLLSSFSEGTSMTLLEAMSLGKPCVVTDVGGNAEIIESRTIGIAVPSNESEQFANAIIELLRSDNKDKQFGNSTESFRRRFAAPIIAEAYASLYRSF